VSNLVSLTGIETMNPAITLQHILAAKGAAVYCAQPATSVREAARRMAHKHIGALVVLEDQRLAGLFTEGDLVRRVIAPGLDPDRVTLVQVMTRDLVTASPQTTTHDAIRLMHQWLIRHLPITNDADQVVGVISMRDLTNPRYQPAPSSAA